MNYTGKKHHKYIWIPKPKSDLREYREILRLCNDLESKNGFFNDKALGIAQVNKGAIFDGSLNAEEYIDKYKVKTIGNQSYISNARMSLRMARFFGWVTRTPEKDAQYTLTMRGKQLAKFSGKFPAKLGDLDEYLLMMDDILGFRFYCVNDSPQYQNKLFKQRVMVNILRYLDKYEYMHNYEVVISALTLKNETITEVNKGFERMDRLRNNKITISQALLECDINPKDNSSLTGVYDGPKVLCSFLKQLLLLEAVDISTLDKAVTKYYEKAYSGSLIKHAPRNVFRITEIGRQIVKRKLKQIPIWYEDIPEPRVANAANILTILNNNAKGMSDDEIRNITGIITKSIPHHSVKGGVDLEGIDFKLHRDIPPEQYKQVITILIERFPDLLSSAKENSIEVFMPKCKKVEKCIKCYPPRCSSYVEYLEVPNSLDYLAYKVCPSDAIARDNNSGKMMFNADKCSLCLLCLLKCPFGAIQLSGSTLRALEVPNNDDTDYMQKNGNTEEIKQLTDNIVEKAIKPSVNIDRLFVVKLFEKAIGKGGNCWAQDEFYTWVRNCFRTLGLITLYTGGKGMKTRSDVTIVEPFCVAIEVKSPSEGKVTGKAVRQTDDAAAQLFAKFHRVVYMAAIGQEISPEAIRKADEHKKYRESRGVKDFNILLLTSKVLLYLTLLNVEMKLIPSELEILFRDYHGEMDSNKLADYLRRVNKDRKIKDISKYLDEIKKLFTD